MDRHFLIVSTICFLVAVVRTVIELRGGVFRPARFYFLDIGLGFFFQNAFISLLGHVLGRCLLTVLFLWGFVFYTLVLASCFFVGKPLPWLQIICAIGVWLLYALILQGRHLRRFSPKRVAALCIIGFSAALTLLWGITFTAQLHSP